MGALEAADDEMGHAVLSAGIASTYDGSSISLEGLSSTTRTTFRFSENVERVDSSMM